MKPLSTRVGAWTLVAAVVAWNLANLHSELLPVAYLDDATVHSQMVRFATRLLSAGSFPLTSWFPYLGAGSPQFLHYQSVPAILTGMAGLVLGPGTAFRLSLYGLLSLWPVVIYAGARLLGLRRSAAAGAAVAAPFLASVPGVGYEDHAYVWLGYGVWTQLWASCALPLAWGLSWRAFRDGRGVVLAALAVAATVVLHYETGYLALAPLPFLALAAPGPPRRRLTVLLLVVAGALLLAAWVVWPVLDQASWAARNEALQGTPLVNGYGIGHDLAWLFGGSLLDHGRFPVLTILMWVGLIECGVAARRERLARALLILLGVSFLLALGPSTLGSLARMLPGGHDIFFRRFLMGVQLAAVLLAGRGAAFLGRELWRVLTRELLGARAALAWGGTVCTAVAIVVAVIVLAPAWRAIGQYDGYNTDGINGQRAADRTQGRELERLVAIIRRQRGGRVYAGSPNNWGSGFTVGSTPVFKYLERLDIDEIGYTLRTASLMTGPEFYFDDQQPSDYALLGIRWLILPSGGDLPVPAHFVASAGNYALWQLPVGAGAYFHVGTIVGTLGENRTDIGRQSLPYLESSVAAGGGFLAVRWGTPRPWHDAAATSRRIGSVRSEDVALVRGRAEAVVALKRAGVVVLSASYDPGWRVSVDGHPARLRMVAPALVAVDVPAGTHRVAFVFAGYGGYGWLFALSLLTLLGLLAIDRRLGGGSPRSRLSPSVGSPAPRIPKALTTLGRRGTARTAGP